MQLAIAPPRRAIVIADTMVAKPNPYMAATSSNAKARAQPKRRSILTPIVPGFQKTRVTQQWLRAHKQMLSDLDWVERHVFFANLQRILPVHCVILKSWFAPDQLLCGTNTGRRPATKRAIALHDAPGRKIMRQKTIPEYFKFASQK